VEEILAALTPDLLNVLAWLVGALVIGGTVLAGMLFLSDYFGRWF
jgi:hypothetical protein